MKTIYQIMDELYSASCDIMNKKYYISHSNVLSAVIQATADIYKKQLEIEQKLKELEEQDGNN